jgi:hypothetical protein
LRIDAVEPRPRQSGGSNEEWRIEKLGFLTPKEAREQFKLKVAA